MTDNYDQRNVYSDASLTKGSHLVNIVTLHIREVFIITQSSKINGIKKTEKENHQGQICLSCHLFRQNEHDLTTTKKNTRIDRHTQIDTCINI